MGIGSPEWTVPARVQRKLRFDDGAAELRGDECNRFGSTVGEKQALAINVHGVCQSVASHGGIGVTAERVEVRSDDGTRIYSDGVERL
jgi:hypothetical protein